MIEEEIPAWVSTGTRTMLFVGMVANNWSKLERVMVPLTAKLLDCKNIQAVKVVIFSQSSIQRYNMIDALAKICRASEEWKEKLKDFLNEYDELRIKRNNIVHGHWGSFSDDGSAMLVRISKANRKLTEDDHVWSPKELILVANRIDGLVGLAGELTRSYPSWEERKAES